MYIVSNTLPADLARVNEFHKRRHIIMMAINRAAEGKMGVNEGTWVANRYESNIGQGIKDFARTLGEHLAGEYDAYCPVIHTLRYYNSNGEIRDCSKYIPAFEALLDKNFDDAIKSIEDEAEYERDMRRTYRNGLGV